MNRLLVLAGVLSLGILAAASVQAEDKEGLPTQAIMKKSFGKNGLCKACIDLGDKKDWSDAAAKAKDFYAVIEGLPKGEPKKGEKSDFEKRAKAFVKSVKSLKDAIDAKDEKKYTAAKKSVTGACKGCHTAHR